MDPRTASARLKKVAFDVTPPIVMRAAQHAHSARRRRVNVGRGVPGARNTKILTEYGADWYDQSFAANGEHYRQNYWEQNWYGALSVVADRILQMGQPKVLDMGCGPAPLARLLYDRGLVHYTGFDFSRERLKFAKQLIPEYRFEYADVYTTDLFETDYDVVVGTEFLEHLDRDLFVLDRIRAGVRVLCNVPDYASTSHVRHFRNEQEVNDRYASKFSDQFSVARMRNVSGTSEYLFDGIRAATPN